MSGRDVGTRCRDVMSGRDVHLGQGWALVERSIVDSPHEEGSSKGGHFESGVIEPLLSLGGRCESFRPRAAALSRRGRCAQRGATGGEIGPLGFRQTQIKHEREAGGPRFDPVEDFGAASERKEVCVWVGVAVDWIRILTQTRRGLRGS